MNHTRRDLLKAMGAVAASMVFPKSGLGNDQPSGKKTHIVTLSFDDGFKKSSIKTAEIYEKHKLSACINVVASAHMKDFRPPDYHNVPRSDFGLWNDLKARGHEIMPHSYKHANLRQLPFEEAKGLILRCLDVFLKELRGYPKSDLALNYLNYVLCGPLFPQTKEPAHGLATQNLSNRLDGRTMGYPGAIGSARQAWRSAAFGQYSGGRQHNPVPQPQRLPVGHAPS